MIQIVRSDAPGIVGRQDIVDFIRQITPERLELTLTTHFKDMGIERRTRVEKLIREVWTDPSAGPELQDIAYKNYEFSRIL